MARKADSGWRDELIGARHSFYGFSAPAAGMILPMIEYDRGNAVGLVSYQRWGHGLPQGVDVVGAHAAFANVHAKRDGSQLPFLTAVYDPNHWTFKVFAHNDAAKLLVGTGWQVMTEREYATTVYAMRSRSLPDLSGYGVEWNTVGETWSDREVPEAWPGQTMSYRRRAWEPMAQTPFKLRVPCMDVDLAVVDVDQRLAMVVDYKRKGSAYPTPKGGWNLMALGSLEAKRCGYLSSVAAFVAEYAPVKPEWDYRVHPLNTTARGLLSYTLGSTGAGTKRLADAIAGTGWLDLTETQWRDVLGAARNV